MERGEWCEIDVDFFTSLQILVSHFRQERPYHSDSTASRLLSEVKHCRARLVLRWGTTLESLVLFFCIFFVFPITPSVLQPLRFGLAQYYLCNPFPFSYHQLGVFTCIAAIAFNICLILIWYLCHYVINSFNWQPADSIPNADENGWAWWAVIWVLHHSWL